MFTSLDGARSSSTLPTGGTSPLQFEKRMSRKNETKIGTYGRPLSPARPTPKSESDSYKVS